LAADRRWPLIAATVVLLVHGAIVLRLGVMVPPDSVQFSAWADSLIANRFNFVAVVHAAGAHNVPTGMYLFFATLVALAKLVAGAAWPKVLVGANLIFDATAAAILVRLVVCSTRSSAAVLLAIAAWLVCFDLVTWVRMPLSDVPFLLTSFAAFAWLVAPRKKSPALAAVMVMISVLLRPVGFLWLILMTVDFLVVTGRVRRGRVIAGGLAVAALVFVAHTYVVRYPEHWPIGAFARSVRWDARSYQRGEVVLSRPETYHQRPSTITDYTAITADRFVHFFAFTAASFSRAHKLAGAAFYIPLYLLALIALARRREEVVMLSAMIVLLVAFWHALVVVDYDWRYRLPLLPHLIFMAACAIPATKSRLPPCDG
jgi:hypothetical protein